MKITNYEQLNKLVAQSLGWTTSLEPLTQREIYHPIGLNEHHLEDWRYKYEFVPGFSDDWNCVEEFILSECDRQKLAVQIIRTSHMISCSIKPMPILSSADNRSPRSFMTGEMGIPKSMPLAVCLAWLRFTGHSLELELDA